MIKSKIFETKELPLSEKKTREPFCLKNLEIPATPTLNRHLFPEGKRGTVNFMVRVNSIIVERCDDPKSDCKASPTIASQTLQIMILQHRNATSIKVPPHFLLPPLPALES